MISYIFILYFSYTCTFIYFLCHIHFGSSTLYFLYLYTCHHIAVLCFSSPFSYPIHVICFMSYDLFILMKRIRELYVPKGTVPKGTIIVCDNDQYLYVLEGTITVHDNDL